MNILSSDTIIPITEARRNFGKLEDLVGKHKEVILTKAGWPYMSIRLAKRERKKRLSELTGILKGTKLDDDKLWKKVFSSRKSKAPTSL